MLDFVRTPRQAGLATMDAAAAPTPARAAVLMKSRLVGMPPAYPPPLEKSNRRGQTYLLSLSRETEELRPGIPEK